ncbi:rhamnulokinase [Anaerobiospirillum thomasii]|uniref:Rhamnulokinase n=1 Tax=Anaerobiospirillum thomasii TaxID=179995 RepID=A0A2X0VMN0_9GAMM|nr:rhamnulokinase family protein [Anaerobiospirillum thomasii]SPT69000.1 Rhamnulokinase [Anaerobiospirillum thomasii]
MMNYHMAIDIGASSGRLIVGFIENQIIKTQEIYRFKNSPINKDGHLIWDIKALFNHILQGLKKCKEQGITISTLAVDTWAVDYVLVDDEGNLCDEPYTYRDSRTDKVDNLFYAEIMSLYELYKRNGIQKLKFNTIYQLFVQNKTTPDVFKKAKHLLMIPDYINYQLTGIACSEYTNATTSQLVCTLNKDWDYELIDKLGLPRNIFKPLHMPGYKIGRLKDSIKDIIGYDFDVLMCASHDTASAVVAAPMTGKDNVYLSSGTWSLIGIESYEPDSSLLSFEHNFTNEGGYDYRYRFLKNIMGLWVLQNLRKEQPSDTTFEMLYQMAQDGSGYKYVVDINNQIFLAPQKMSQAFVDYCSANNIPSPSNFNEILFCAYNSLAHYYKTVIEEIEYVKNVKISTINIVGGGSQDEFLNALIAKVTKRKIYCGPTEATAIGNLCAQMISSGEIADLQEARNLIVQSFNIKSI